MAIDIWGEMYILVRMCILFTALTLAGCVTSTQRDKNYVLEFGDSTAAVLKSTQALRNGNRNGLGTLADDTWQAIELKTNAQNLAFRKALPASPVAIYYAEALGHLDEPGGDRARGLLFLKRAVKYASWLGTCTITKSAYNYSSEMALSVKAGENCPGYASASYKFRPALHKLATELRKDPAKRLQAAGLFILYAENEEDKRWGEAVGEEYSKKHCTWDDNKISRWSKCKCRTIVWRAGRNFDDDDLPIREAQACQNNPK